MVSPGQLVRTARLSAGLTQGQLARRAGTTQSAISRLERDAYSPTIESLESVLTVLGCELELDSPRRLHGVTPDHLAGSAQLSASERFVRGLGFNRVARRFFDEGRRLRESR